VDAALASRRDQVVHRQFKVKVSALPPTVLARASHYRSSYGFVIAPLNYSAGRFYRGDSAASSKAAICIQAQLIANRLHFHCRLHTQGSREIQGTLAALGPLKLSVFVPPNLYRITGTHSVRDRLLWNTRPIAII
jgi:hypothetical protein